MLTNKHDIWTDEKVDSTVTAHYVYSHLRPDEAEKLTIRVFATFSDDTYLQWILIKAKRLFLTLTDANIAGQIFRLIDESYDDEDLPISEDDILTLRLPQSRGQVTNQLFYRCQFRYLFRVVGPGEHIRYASSEVVPIQSAQPKQIPLKDAPDKVILPTTAYQVLLRKRVELTEERDEVDVLAEIAAARSLQHDHVLSVFGSYTQGNDLNLLLSPATRYTLKAFLSDTPKNFEALSKFERRKHLLSWASCLGNALAWLHAHGIWHGAIRPSRIHIDDNFQPSLGYFDSESVLGLVTAKDDLEAYQYAAPELWKRELTLQGRGTTKSSSMAPSRITSSRQGHRTGSESRRKSINMGLPDIAESAHASGKSYAFLPISKGNGSRLRLQEYTRNMSMKPSAERDLESRMSSRQGPPKEATRMLSNMSRRFDAMSLGSSGSSEGGSKSGNKQSKSLYFIPAEVKTTVVQTWKSTAHNLPAADVFALAAVIMDLLTVLCGRTVSSFAKHRASKNRQAGRGGGVADASFHANLPQVASWAEALHKDAEKKVRKEEGLILQAVGPTLQVLIQCLDRDFGKRMQSALLAQRLQRHLTEFAGIKNTHCQFTPPKQKLVLEKGMSDSADEALALVGQDEKSTTDSSDLRQSEKSSGAKTLTRYIDEYELDGLPSRSRGTRSSAYLSSDSDAAPEPSARQRRHERVVHLDKYDDGPTRPRTHPPPESEPYRPSKVPGRLRIDPSEDESDVASQPSLYSKTTLTHTSRERSEPNTPASIRAAYTLFPDVPGDYRPPDRELPPIPAVQVDPQIGRSASNRRPKNLGHQQQPLARIGQATHMPPRATATERAESTTPPISLNSTALSKRFGSTSSTMTGMSPDENVSVKVVKTFEMHPGQKLELTPPPLKLNYGFTTLSTAEEIEEGEFDDFNFYATTTRAKSALQMDRAETRVGGSYAGARRS